MEPEEERMAPARSVMGAAAGWVALLAFIYAASPLFGVRVGGIAGFVGSLITGRTGPAAEWIGRFALLVVALIWGLGYAAVRRAFIGPEWARGLFYGLIVWLFSGVVLLPVMGALHPLAGTPGVERPGFFGVGFGGLAGVTLSLVSHAVFGLTLGLVSALRLRS